LILRKGRVRRFQKIINTMARHGFGQLIQELGVSKFARHLRFSVRKKEKRGIKKYSNAVRLRMVMEELGTTFIKFGQLLSTRSDLLPREYILELQKLQDDIAPIPFAQVKDIIEEELHGNLETLYKHLEETPIAAASIGQVHGAELLSGEKVVIKIQRPHIRKTIAQDLDILREIAHLLDKYTNLGKMYHFGEIVDEFSHIINMELNYYHEARNAERIKKNFHDDKTVFIPGIYWDHTSTRVITMEYVEGIKLKENDRLLQAGFSPRKIAENLSKAYLKQILLDGYFHGDPHPGNIGIIPADGRLFFLDFGIAGGLDEKQLYAFSKLLLGFLGRDVDEILDSILSLGIVTEQTDPRQLRLQLERLHEKYYDLPLKEINLGQSLHELMDIAAKHHIRLPADFTLLAKTFLTLEGLLTDLSPDFSIAELAQPMSKEIFRKQFSSKRVIKSLYKNARKYKRLLEYFPERFLTILDRGAEGNLKVKVEIFKVEQILNDLNFMVNRLSFSIVLASIIVGLCLILQFTETTIFRYFALAEIGLILAAAMGFWWLWSILRSGRL